MKGKVALFLLIVASMLLCFYGCMGNDSIVILGEKDGYVTINPTFEWENPKGDDAFLFRLEDADGNALVETEVTGTLYESEVTLDYDATYRVTVEGKTSGTTHKRKFTTRSGDNTDELSGVAISLSEPYRSYMVIQRDRAFELAGKTLENLLVTVEFNGGRYYALSDDAGNFSLTLPAMAANAVSQDLTVRVTPTNKLTLQDVLIGDVYLVSGQSNIQRFVSQSDCTAADVTNAIASNVRYFGMSENTATKPIDSVKNGKWFKISASDTGYKNWFSAIAFMFGSMLSTELADAGVPVGIMCACKGDTNIVNWMSKDYYNGSISTKNMHYNGMIYPLRRAEFKGVIWYQGCNNSAKGADYEGLLNDLIANWRNLFRYEEMPFYIVQLPVFNGDSGNNYDFSYVRESQMKVTEADPNAYLIATCDGGDPNDIHPRQKRYISERLTKSVLSTIYGEDCLPQGPVYASHTFDGARAIVSVKYGDGLRSAAIKDKNGNDIVGEEIVGFELAGADGKYYDATARIEDGKIVVTSAKVSAPKYIRYGFSKSPYLNVYNEDGYLMSPFRTDDHNRNIDLLEYEDLDRYEPHPDTSASAMTPRVVTVNGETGLEVTKADDGGTFGSLLLYKWGAIGYDELGMKIRVVGTASGAKVLLRFVEGPYPYEIWAFSFTDDEAGLREFTFPTSELACVANLSDGIVDYQAIRNVEITIESAGGATVTFLEARFVEVARSAPTAFSISDCREEGDSYLITYTRATFAEGYRVVVSRDGTNYSSPVLDRNVTETQVTFPSSLLEKNATYYVKVTATNELGTTAARNSGYTFTPKTTERYVINTFDYLSEEAFEAYLRANMLVHSALHPTLDEKGVKIVADGEGWQYFIFNLEAGANQGYDALRFYMDVSDYYGEVIVDLVDARGNTYHTWVDISYKRNGIFEIPLNSFFSTENESKKFDGRDVARLQFNFSDYNQSVIYLDDVEFVKK